MAKKKSTQLSSLQKAFGIAAKFPSLQPNEFRNILVKFKRNNAENRKKFGYQESSAAMPQQDASNYQNWKILRQADKFSFFCSFVRDLMLEDWYQKKRVFVCSDKLIKYVIHEFPFEYLSQRLDEWLFQISRAPIYLEFSDGLTIPEQATQEGDTVPSQVLQGAFFGQCYIQNEEFMNGKLSHAIIGVQVSHGTQLMSIHCNPLYTIKDYFSCNKYDTYQDITMAILAYLSFVYGKEDAIGTALIPKTRQGTAECYDVQPIPFLDSIPNKHDPTSVIVAGLCTSLGYLSRHNMSAQLKKARDKMPADITYNFQALDMGADENSILFLRRKTCDMILMWEQYRIIYQYDEVTAAALKNKYLEDISLWGFPKDLLRYFPQDVIILHQPYSSQIVLMSISDIIDSNGNNSNGIMVASVVDDDIRMGMFPVDSVVQGIQGPEDTIDLTLDSICVLYHILAVYKEKALKKIVKDVLTAGNPTSTDLVTIQQQPEISHVPVDATLEQEPLAYRVGQVIENAPFELFSVTQKTVKRQRQEEKKIRMGWKVTPHVRRPHPHRYWVGHGAEKHLEVRWLDRMQIHKDKTADKTTLHQVKV